MCSFIFIRIADRKGPSLLQSVIHTVTIGTTLNFNGSNNGHGLKTLLNVLTRLTFCFSYRYYLRKDGVCIMRMVDAEFEYTYEYQGNAPKLVHTPLTDKCYLTLTQGKALFLYHSYSVSCGVNHHGGL